MTLEKTQGSFLVQLHFGFSEKDLNADLAMPNVAQASQSDPEKVINARG